MKTVITPRHVIQYIASDFTVVTPRKRLNLMGLNLRKRRIWSRRNHRCGVRRWALQRAVFHISFFEALEGLVTIYHRLGTPFSRNYDLET